MRKLKLVYDDVLIEDDWDSIYKSVNNVVFFVISIIKFLLICKKLKDSRTIYCIIIIIIIHDEEIMNEYSFFYLTEKNFFWRHFK